MEHTEAVHRVGTYYLAALAAANQHILRGGALCRRSRTAVTVRKRRLWGPVLRHWAGWRTSEPTSSPVSAGRTG
ncbi:hypothetical protein SHKM778_82520 [Streptomyces sp. KM77-8]|uniref:Uncharacterized protein n=1 Tax=Streptomyces haneummycinicus TaxID=3074435 RepID=A0AAT9HW71_9ACTN